MKQTTKGTKAMVYGTTLKDGERFFGSLVANGLERFKKESAVIIANRYSDELNGVSDKLYNSDLFRRD